MEDLVDLVICVVGGMECFKCFCSVLVQLYYMGVIWVLKQCDGVFIDLCVMVQLYEQYVLYVLFVLMMDYFVYMFVCVEICWDDGIVVDMFDVFCVLFDGYEMEILWFNVQLVYFVGYMMWMYLMLLFLLCYGGVCSCEIKLWIVDGLLWWCLYVEFVLEIVMYSVVQMFYFDVDGLLCWYDYEVDIQGCNVVVWYISDYVDV